jgi:hypothetical protein
LTFRVEEKQRAGHSTVDADLFSVYKYWDHAQDVHGSHDDEKAMADKEVSMPTIDTTIVEQFLRKTRECVGSPSVSRLDLTDLA